MNIQPNTALRLIGSAAAGIMITHGCMRIYVDGIEGFGGFVSAKGFPFGTVIAWGITIFEIAGGILLLTGTYVKPTAFIFALHLTMGIFLVHLQNGWFVVGAGRNGIEYSVLLVITFLMVALSQPRWGR